MNSICHPIAAHCPEAAFEKLIGSYYIRGYLQGAINTGCDPKAILMAAGIDHAIYRDPSGQINGEQFQEFILALRETLDDVYMGFLRVPGKLAMEQAARLAAVKEETLGEGIRSLLGFINAVRSDEVRDCAVGESDDCVMSVRFSGFNPGVDPHLLYWYRIYGDYRFYCWLLGTRIRLTCVCFSASRPTQYLDYESIFHCPVYFDQPVDQYCFNKGSLVAPIIRDEVELYNDDYLKPAGNWFTLPGRDQSLASQVEQVLLELIRQGMTSPSIGVIANIMSVSSRTLSRKLAKEDCGFQEIKAKVRRDMAFHLLLNADIPITRIAEKVGFTEPGDFTRAFTAWTGQNPSSYRAARR